MSVGVLCCADDVRLAMQRPKTKKTSNINYHLARMYPKLVGPTKTNK